MFISENNNKLRNNISKLFFGSLLYIVELLLFKQQKNIKKSKYNCKYIKVLFIFTKIFKIKIIKNNNMEIF